jgi:serine/threonine protein kinase
LPDAWRISSDQLAWFEREARAAAALQHPNILTVYDVGVDRDISYVVAELLEGETLRASRCNARRMSVDVVAQLALQIPLRDLRAATTRASSTGTSSPRICSSRLMAS